MSRLREQEAERQHVEAIPLWKIIPVSMNLFRFLLISCTVIQLFACFGVVFVCFLFFFTQKWIHLFTWLLLYLVIILKIGLNFLLL